jgi:MoxR-like ATPase
MMDKSLLEKLDLFQNQANQVLLGKQAEVRLALCCLLAKGHLLIEDVPGVGKTTLATTLAKLLGAEFQRIQFTSDMMPSDILGCSIWRTDLQAFVFSPGPVFRSMVLADEINRATPKAQSALLEAMEEKQITVDGQTYRLPEPFFVIATQNPLNHSGTQALPESQLDRFMMRIELGYPDSVAERLLLKGDKHSDIFRSLVPVLGIEELKQLQAMVFRVYVSDALIDYVMNIINFTRYSGEYRLGLSPRAGVVLLTAARAWALVAGRDSVVPEDVQAVLGAVVGHRIGAAGVCSQQIVESICQQVKIYA